MMDIMLDPRFKALHIVESLVRCRNATKLSFEYDAKVVILFRMLFFDQLNPNIIAFMTTTDDMGWELEKICLKWGFQLKVHVQMGGPIWVSHKPILPCGCHCNAHVDL
jgi:hypothetical protein